MYALISFPPFLSPFINSHHFSKYLPRTRSDKAPHSFHFSDDLVIQTQSLRPFEGTGWGKRREEEREAEATAGTGLALSFPVRALTEETTGETTGKEAAGTPRLFSISS